MAALLRTSFVPLAIDNVVHPNMTPEEKAFFDARFKASTQGMFAFMADGRVLERGGGYDPMPIREMLLRALRQSGPPKLVQSAGALEAADAPLARNEEGRRYPPEGGAVLYVTWKVIEGFAPSAGRHDPILQRAVGVDRIWVRADECQALIAGELPAGLTSRMRRYHLDYVFDEIHKLELFIEGSNITGSFVVGKDRTPALVSGTLRRDGDHLEELTLVFRGLGRRLEDHGFGAGLTVASKEKPVTVAMLFELAAAEEELSFVLPHNLKDRRYLE